MDALIIDDSRAMRGIIKRIITPLGFDAIEAENGQDGLEKLKQFSDTLELILVDWNMPVMDGFATIQILRRLNPQLPIIATTGLAVENQLSRVTELGITHFLRKPCTAEALLKVLKDVLDTAAQKK